MVVRVYISGISGNKEVKKRQQRVTMILDSKNIKYNVIDITEPGKENEKEFMQEKGKARDSKHPLPPQIFNEDNYCGDYEDFDMANELDELEKFLSVSINNSNSTVTANGVTNGSSTEEHEKDESFSIKEDIRESKEENIEIDNENNKEAVSLDKDVQNIPDEVENLEDEHESIKNDDEKEEQEEPEVTKAEIDEAIEITADEE